MIQGSKHYFTLFGIMRSSINVQLQRFFSQMIQLSKICMTIALKQLESLKHNLQKHQTYQG